MKKYVIVSVTGMIVLYLMFSFIMWEFNAGNWVKDVRIGFILMFSCWLLFSIALIPLLNDKYEK